MCTQEQSVESNQRDVAPKSKEEELLTCLIVQSQAKAHCCKVSSYSKQLPVTNNGVNKKIEKKIIKAIEFLKRE